MKQNMQTGSLSVIMMALSLGAGCTGSLHHWVGGGWVADYQVAEQRVAQTDRPLLIHYEHHDGKVDRSLKRALGTPAVKRWTEDHVRCRLFRSYEPHRRYVAQFGVDRAPALIVLHRDGTYHAQTGLRSPADVETFLARAQPPGATPRIDPYLPRKPEYRWLDTLAKAEAAGTRQGKPVLVVYHRPLRSDWGNLEGFLTRREAYTRVADLVHCRIAVWNPWGAHVDTRFGRLKLPAIVWLRPDGTFDRLENPTSYASVVRFADAAMQADPPPPVTQTADKPLGR